MATNLDLAGKVARNVELEAVNLRHASVNAGYEPGELPEEVAIDIQYRTSMERKPSQGGTPYPKLAVTVEFKFKVEAKSDENSIDVMLLEAGYLLTYALNPSAEIEDECFKYFAEVNGPYNAWPYWRELVQSVSGRLGLPGFVVPVFRPVAIDVEASSDLSCIQS